MPNDDVWATHFFKLVFRIVKIQEGKIPNLAKSPNLTLEYNLDNLFFIWTYTSSKINTRAIVQKFTIQKFDL